MLARASTIAMFVIDFDISQVGMGDLLMSTPTWTSQLVLAGLWFAFWQIMLTCVLPGYIKAALESCESCDRLVNFWAAGLKKMSIKIDMPQDRAFVLDVVVMFNGVYTQHLTGALLCVPAVFGFLSPSVASAMARHGALSEVGWEFSDTITRVYEVVFGGKEGRRKNPPVLLFSYALHHCAALSLVLPLNVYYHDSPAYHEAVCLLQSAAVIACWCQQYGFMQDTEVPSQYLKLKISVTLGLVAMVYMRMVRGGYLWYVVLDTLRTDGRTTLFRVALVSVVTMTLFNLMIIGDATHKFVKLVVKKPSRQEMGVEMEGDEKAKTLERQISSGEREIPGSSTLTAAGKPTAAVHRKPKKC